MNTIDWPASRRPPRRRGRLILLIALAVLVFGSGTIVSYYVESLWFDSLGFAAVFWKTINLQAWIFAGFVAATFGILYGAFVALKPAQFGEIGGGTILINGQPFTLPVEPVLRLIASGIALLVAVITGLGMANGWMTLALYWYGAPAARAAEIGVDPIFGRPLTFYLFTLPAWHLIAGWLTTLAVMVCFAAVFFAVVTGGTRLFSRRGASSASPSLRGVSITFAFALLMFAVQVYLGRFDRLYTEGTIFSGVTYTDARRGSRQADLCDTCAGRQPGRTVARRGRRPKAAA